ncbi:MAG TPA: TonB family protein, partial [Spirochaetia bacterium]|nr:TonB family protein [Spirochaetia bacterium]
MRPALVLSLVAALGVHAVILLVPRLEAAGETTELPAVIIDLSQVPAMAMTARAAAAPSQGPAASRPAVPAQTVAPAPAALPESAPASAASQPGPAAEESPLGPEEGIAVAAAAGAAGGATAPGDGAAAAGGSSASGPGSDSGESATAGAGAPASAAPVFSTPAPLAPIQPSYPRAARQSGRQGMVRVAAMVDETGTVTAVEVSQSSGSMVLDRAALAAVRGAVFVPARQDGRAVACR